MYKRTFSAKKILVPASATEVFSILAILAGLLVTFFMTSEGPIRLIGICITILAGFGHFMLVSQRLSNSFESHRGSSAVPPEFKVTVMPGQAGKRMIFDGFESTLDDTRAAEFEKMRSRPIPQVHSRVKDAEKLQQDEPIVEEEKPMKASTKAPPIIPASTEQQSSLSEIEDVGEGIRIIRKQSSGGIVIKKTIYNDTNETDSDTIQPLQKEFTVDTPYPIREQELSEPIISEQIPEETYQYIEDNIEPASNHKRAILEVSLLDFMEENEPAPSEPRKEFDFLLARVLMAIRSVIDARTAGFAWANHDKKQLVIESYISESNDSFTQLRKLPFGNDVISQIAHSGKPEILTEIHPSAELDLLCYYTAAAKTISFIGVPVYFNGNVIGVLFADSDQIDAYDAMSIGFLGNFTKLITGLIQSYTGKYDLLQASRALDAITRFRTIISSSGDGIADLCAALLESASEVVEFTTMGIGMFDYEQQAWTVYQVYYRQVESEKMLGMHIDLEYSLIGNTILTAQTTALAPLTDELRVCDSEIPVNGGYFLAVPLKSQSHNYGALFLEGTGTSLPSHDINIIEMLGEQTGTIIEQLRFHEMFRSTALMDETKGLFNYKAFYARMTEETAKTRDFGNPFSLALIKMDTYESMENLPEIEDDLLMHVIKKVKSNMKEYDIIGEFEGKTIVVALIGQTLAKSHIWGERVRKEIASAITEIGNRRLTVTVSIGIAQAHSYDKADSLIRNASSSLQLASEKTNSVIVYS
jgi:diguanylate cyclase (GGDEF)-like protein